MMSGFGFLVWIIDRRINLPLTLHGQGDTPRSFPRSLLLSPDRDDRKIRENPCFRSLEGLQENNAVIAVIAVGFQQEGTLVNTDDRHLLLHGRDDRKIR